MNPEVTSISNDWWGQHNEPLSPEKAWNITSTKESLNGLLYIASQLPQEFVSSIASW